MESELLAPARILLVHDHPAVRIGVLQVIANLPDLAVCAEVHSMDDALDAVRALSPEVAIVDLSPGGINGLELIRRLRALDARLPIVVFSLYEEPMFAELAFVAGASGYVTQQESHRRLIGVIRGALKRAGEPGVPEAS